MKWPGLNFMLMIFFFHLTYMYILPRPTKQRRGLRENDNSKKTLLKKFFHCPPTREAAPPGVVSLGNWFQTTQTEKLSNAGDSDGT